MHFGEYEKIDELGHGASGYVYKCSKGSELYAVKVCTGMYNEALKRFDREIRIAQSLNHPNIVKVYDYDMNASNPYFAMELCDGSLANQIAGKSFDELLSLSIEVCEAVDALHKSEVIHRDIKPGNILVKNGHVKVTDFSFGAFINHDSTTLTASDQLVGTEGYIAPEVFSQGGHHATMLSDIYSLGCTLWFIFSGGISPNYYQPQLIQPNIVRIIEKCRENDPSLRYGSVQELIEELRALQQPMAYLGILELKEHELEMSKAAFRNNAFQLLMKNDRWDELIADLRLLGNSRLKDIIQNVPGAGNDILLLLENVYNNDTENWKQFDDIDTYTSLCAQVFASTEDVLAKQKAIDMTLGFSINYNRWPAMRIIKNSMLEKLTDEEIRSLSGFFRSNKDLLKSLEDSLGTCLKRSLRLAAGLV
ncbi:MAG: serine/threonine protein kinase [Bacteroidales bacterium]|nr:serine/threonine protein kinase [Bacteroidales bacterium]